MNGSRQQPRQRFACASGFTMLELMGVIAIISLLVLLVIGLNNRANKVTAVNRAQSDIATIGMANELFKSDFGYYPTSSLVRIDQWYGWDQTNSSLLYNQIVATGRNYFRPPKHLIGKSSTGAATFFVDPFSKAYNYYSTMPVIENITWTGSGGPMQNYAWSGGQVNRATFDLFSYGFDGRTYPGPAPADAAWNNPATAVDDITNWTR